jgi:hypothetical protein
MISLYLPDNQSQYSFIFNSVNLIHASPADQSPPVTKARHVVAVLAGLLILCFSTKTVFVGSKM